jgi:hypothetical protein
MHERPDTFVLSDTRHLPQSGVVGSGAFRAVPRGRTVEDSIAKGDPSIFPEFSRLASTSADIGALAATPALALVARDADASASPAAAFKKTPLA